MLDENLLVKRLVTSDDSQTSRWIRPKTCGGVSATQKKQPEKRKSGNVDWKATRKKIQQDGMLRDSNQKQSQLNKKKNRAQSTISGFDQAK